MQARTTEEAIGRRWMVGLKFLAYVSRLFRIQGVTSGGASLAG